LDVKAAWDNILAGKSGIQPITHFDCSAFSTRFGGPIYGFDATQYIPAKDTRKMDKFIHYGVAAGSQALADSGLEVTDENRRRIGVAVGSGIGGISGIESSYEAFLKGGPRKISAFFVPANIINMVAGDLSIKYGLQGPNYSIVSACATGTHNIGEAGLMIRHGYVDVMVAGGAEMGTSPE
jgi:3-oxoacyl-[acyl-carrier-protein] synthase II